MTAKPKRFNFYDEATTVYDHIKSEEMSDEGESSEEESDEDSEGDAASGDEEEDTSEEDDDEDDGSDTDSRETTGSVTEKRTGKYEESQEAYPAWPIYDPKISVIREECSQISGVMLEMLDSLECQETKAIENFTATSEKLLIQDPPEPIVIGLLGHTGAGKSETLNMILDQPGLAKANAAGTACTAVVSEYTSANPDQKQAFEVHVRLFDRADRLSLLNEQVDNIFIYHKLKAKGGKAAKDPDAEKVLKPLYETAVKVFRALFCTYRKEFRDQKSAEKYLQPRKRRTNAVLTNELEKWLDAILEARHAGSSSVGVYVEHHECSSIAQLHKVLGPLTASTMRQRTPSLWPVVDRITVACKTSRVLKNAMLVDLPGVADTNKVRVRSAEAYLTHCDYLLMFSPIDRVCADATVSRLLQQYGTQFRGRIAIVATKTDPDFLKLDDLADDTVPAGAKMKAFKQLRKELKANEKELNRVEKKQHPVGKGKDDLEAKIKAIKTKQLHFVVHERNHAVTRDLRNNKKGYCYEGEELPVFCISNMHYLAAKKPSQSLEIVLEPEATGIPGLRKHILALTGPRQMAKLNRYLDAGVSALTKGLMVWAHAQEVKSPVHLRSLIQRPRAEFTHHVDSELTKPCQIAANGISDPLQKMQTHELYGENSRKIIEHWQKDWHWGTVKAFVRNNGTPGMKSVKAGADWNRELSHAAVQQYVKPTWRGLSFALERAFERLETRLIKQIKDLAYRLDAEPEAQDLPLAAFAGLVQSTLDDLKHDISDCRMACIEEYLRISGFATSEMTGGFFVQAMEDVYRICADVKGKGAKARILSIIQEYVTQTGHASPFAVFGTSIVNAISYNVQQCADRIALDVCRAVEKVEMDFESMVITKGQQGIDHAARDKVKSFLEREKIMERVEKVKAERDAIIEDPKYAHVKTQRQETFG